MNTAIAALLCPAERTKVVSGLAATSYHRNRGDIPNNAPNNPGDNPMLRRGPFANGTPAGNTDAGAVVKLSHVTDRVPVEGASVGFSPAGPGGLPASAQTKAGGTFRLGTRLPAAGKVGAGASPGDYVVIIEKVDAPPPETFAPDDPRYGRAQPPTPKITYIVPQSYGVRDTTPLKATVRKGPNAFTFELDSKKP